MRQVFTSQRLETVEGVARMLQDAGIPVYVSQSRSYRSRRSGQFSYSDPTPANQQPAVWVRLAADQPRARELLRQAGLMTTTRSYSELPQTVADALPLQSADAPSRWRWRIRVGLMLLITAVVVLMWMRRHPSADSAVVVPASPAVPTTQPAQQDPETGEEEFRVRISPPPADPAPR